MTHSIRGHLLTSPENSKSYIASSLVSNPFSFWCPITSRAGTSSASATVDRRPPPVRPTYRGLAAVVSTSTSTPEISDSDSCRPPPPLFKSLTAPTRLDLVPSMLYYQGPVTVPSNGGGSMKNVVQFKDVEFATEKSSSMLPISYYRSSLILYIHCAVLRRVLWTGEHPQLVRELVVHSEKKRRVIGISHTSTQY